MRAAAAFGSAWALGAIGLFGGRGIRPDDGFMPGTMASIMGGNPFSVLPPRLSPGQLVIHGL